MDKVRPTIARLWLMALASLFPYAAQAAEPDVKPILTTLYNFPAGDNGANPQAGMVLGSSGAYYGSTYTGGAASGGVPTNWGTVYELAPPSSPGGAWTESVLYTFQGGADGANPRSALVIGDSNILYGTTYYGGAYGYGAVFQVVPPTMPGGAWTESVIYSFQGVADGANPAGDIIVCSNPAVCTPGTLFGATTAGGTPGYGTVFQLLPPAVSGDAWTEKQLYVFQGGSDGADPQAGLIMQTVTNQTSMTSTMLLYGTTYEGGTPGWGTIFQLVPPATSGDAWKENLLYSFTGLTDGGGPQSLPYPIVKSKITYLYGTTFFDGSAKDCSLGGFVLGCGTAYELAPPAKSGGKWTLNVLYTFTGNGSDGAHPSQAIGFTNGGAIYLTTYSGGSTSDVCYGQNFYPGCGTIMELKPPAAPGDAWTAVVLHDFGGDDDGGSPNGVFPSTSGSLFGTAALGGNARGDGTIFELIL